MSEGYKKMARQQKTQPVYMCRVVGKLHIAMQEQFAHLLHALSSNGRLKTLSLLCAFVSRSPQRGIKQAWQRTLARAHGEKK